MLDCKNKIFFCLEMKSKCISNQNAFLLLKKRAEIIAGKRNKKK